MTFPIIRAVMLAGAIAIVSALPALASFASGSTDKRQFARAVGITLAAKECFTDDGSGRRRPCSAGYKREKPNRQSSKECMTDDGSGRHRHCAVNYKRKRAKE